MERTDKGVAMPEKERDAAYVSVVKDHLHVVLWIDVPNTFPWRKCLTNYDKRIITKTCDTKVRDGLLLI